MFRCSVFLNLFRFSCLTLIALLLAMVSMAAGPQSPFDSPTLPISAGENVPEAPSMFISGLDGTVRAVIVYDGDLIAGGSFLTADGEPTSRLARWDGTQWHAMGDGANSTVYCLLVHDGSLIVGGNFTEIDGTPASKVAAWDGVSWSEVGGGITGGYGVYALETYGGDLHAAGYFEMFDDSGVVSRVARLDGSGWIPLGDGFNSPVYDLEVWDSDLWVAGSFNTPARGIAHWNGSHWQYMGLGLGHMGSGSALEVFDDRLIIGGHFDTALLVPVNNIAAWDGSTMTPLGDGIQDLSQQYGGKVTSLCLYNGRLIAGGNFNFAGDDTASCIAAWDGTNWSPMGDGLNDWVFDQTIYGTDLVVGGSFTQAGSVPAGHITSWNDTLWDAISNLTGMDISIDMYHDISLGDAVDISVTLDAISPEASFNGFDFLVSFDADAISLVDVQPGSLLVDCEWEYFVYRVGAIGNCGDDPCPEGMARIVAVADLNDGDNHPLCIADQSGELIQMGFQVTTDPAFECYFAPIHFMWYDCGDNAVALYPDGDTLLISNRVFYHDDYEVTQDTTFPTPFGAPSECLEGGPGVRRAVDYHGGGIDIVCADSIDARGDLNLNNVANEIADWVLFVNYMLYGPSVFTIDFAVQSVASDVNADGLTLTLDDLIYLWRVIIGDALPYPSPPLPAVDTAIIVQDTVVGTVSFDATDSLGGVYLIFEGEITPILADSGLPSVQWHYDTTHTKVLWAWGMDSLPISPSGMLFAYTGDGQIMAASAGTDGVTPVVVIVQGSSAMSCCIQRGNFDGDPQGNINIADVTALIQYLFAGGPAAPCYPEGNVDGDAWEVVNISDLILLVGYLFGGDNPPPPCP